MTRLNILYYYGSRTYTRFRIIIDRIFVRRCVSTFFFSKVTGISKTDPTGIPRQQEQDTATTIFLRVMTCPQPPCILFPSEPSSIFLREDPCLEP